MIIPAMRTAQLFGQMADGMMFHVVDIHMDLFVKLVSMLNHLYIFAFLGCVSAVEPHKPISS